MDAWLKSAVKLGAENLQQLVSGDGSRREVEFIHSGSLGFELDGVRVASVEREGQAAKLGVQVGDQVLAVDGYEVSMPKQRSEDALKQAQAQAESWLKSMPRPGSVTFLNAEAASEKEKEAAAADKSDRDASAVSATAAVAVDVGKAAEGSQGSSDVARLEKAVPRSPDQVAGAAGEAQGSGGACLEVAGGGSGFKEQLAAMRAELDAERERVVTLRGELYVSEEQGRSAESELQEARRECQALRHMAVEQDDGVGIAQPGMDVQMRTLQDQLARAREDADVAKRQAAEAQAELKRAEERCQQLQRVGAQAEEVFSDAFEGRERVLEEEVARLRALNSNSEMEHQQALALAAERLEGAEARAREQLQAESARRASEVQDVEARASAAEAGAAVALRELRAEREAHKSSLLRLAADHDQAVGRLQAQLDETLARAAAAESAASAAPEANGNASKTKPWSPDSDSEEEPLADVETGAQPAILAASPAPQGSPRQPLRQAAHTDDGASLGASIEVMDLRERVQQLERRCCMLQKKLNQRPIVFQAPTVGKAEDPSSAGSGQGMWWEPRIRSALGPQQATRVIQLLTLPDRALKSFTMALLKREAWLRFFYLHVVVLYAVAAAWFAQTESDLAASPLDAFSHGGVVQQHASSAQAGVAVAGLTSGGAR